MFIFQQPGLSFYGLARSFGLLIFAAIHHPGRGLSTPFFHPSAIRSSRGPSSSSASRWLFAAGAWAFISAVWPELGSILFLEDSAEFNSPGQTFLSAFLSLSSSIRSAILPDSGTRSTLPASRPASSGASSFHFISSPASPTSSCRNRPENSARISVSVIVKPVRPAKKDAWENIA